MNGNVNVTLDMVYRKLEAIEEEVKEISEDVHRVKPEYVAKLEKIEKGKTRQFKNVEEMDKYLETS